MAKSDYYTMAIKRTYEPILEKIGKYLGNPSKPKITENCIKVANELFDEDEIQFSKYLRK